MQLILLLLLFFIWIQNQIFSFASPTITTPRTVIDLQDGHPNHQLWQKMIDTGRASSNDWYVNNLHLLSNLFCPFLLLPFCSELCSLIKLI
jgi:hypothetical protein